MSCCAWSWFAIHFCGWSLVEVEKFLLTDMQWRKVRTGFMTEKKYIAQHQRRMLARALIVDGLRTLVYPQQNGNMEQRQVIYLVEHLILFYMLFNGICFR